MDPIKMPIEEENSSNFTVVVKNTQKISYHHARPRYYAQSQKKYVFLIYLQKNQQVPSCLSFNLRRKSNRIFDHSFIINYLTEMTILGIIRYVFESCSNG